MLSKIFKSLAWGILTSDVQQRWTMHKDNTGKSATFAQVKAWKKESYKTFMADPHWWDRIAYKEMAIMAALIMMLVGMLLFMAFCDTYTPTGNLENINYVLDKYK